MAHARSDENSYLHTLPSTKDTLDFSLQLIILKIQAILKTMTQTDKIKKEPKTKYQSINAISQTFTAISVLKLPARTWQGNLPFSYLFNYWSLRSKTWIIMANNCNPINVFSLQQMQHNYKLCKICLLDWRYWDESSGKVTCQTKSSSMPDCKRNISGFHVSRDSWGIHSVVGTQCVIHNTDSWRF